ncbi:unnamed protein product [Jaminaea pallidilutea]
MNDDAASAVALTHLNTIKIAPPASSSSGAQQSRSHVSNHLLPESISPTMDLALVFSTVAPPPASSNAAASTGAAPAAAGPSQAGLSAAQRLIQQRVAMMKARAAAAAGLASSSSAASADASAGPLKGQPIGMTLWRMGSGPPEIVWKKDLAVPDAVFGFLDRKPPSSDSKGKQQSTGGTERQHQTVEVAGMQWSPDGRTIALSVIASRASPKGDDPASTHIVALYDIHDGKCLRFIPLGHKLGQSKDRLPRATPLQWIAIKPLCKEPVQRLSQRTRAYWSEGTTASTRAMAALKILVGQENSSHNRFHGVNQDGRGGSTLDLDSLVWPTSRGLEANKPASQAAEEEAKPGEGDIFRGWHALTSDSDQLSEPHALVVPTLHHQLGPGAMLLIMGKIPIVFVPLDVQNEERTGKRRLLTALLNETGSLWLQGVASGGTQSQVMTKRQQIEAVARDIISAVPIRRTLEWSSSLYLLCSSALNLAALLTVNFQLLGMSTSLPDDRSPLSAQQANSLPPLRRLQYELRRLSIDHVQDAKDGLIASLTTGVHPDMIESLLLNTWSEGKWRQQYNLITELYAQQGVFASRLSAALTEMLPLLNELLGAAKWAERTAPTERSPACGLQLSVNTLQDLIRSVSSLVSCACQVEQYTMGERLAWSEMDKWVVWERDRLESIRAETGDPMDAKTFDPVVVVELVNRDFECQEMNWLVLEIKSKLDAGDGEEAGQELPAAENEDSEVSFEIAGHRGAANDQSGTSEAVAGKTDVDESMAPGAADASGINGSSATATSSTTSSALMQAIDGVLNPETSACKQEPRQSSPSLPPPYPVLFQAGINASDDGRGSVYEYRPVTKELERVVLGIKAIFKGSHDRMTEQMVASAGGAAAVSTMDAAGLGVGVDDEQDNPSSSAIVSLAAPRPDTASSAARSKHRRVCCVTITHQDIGGDSKGDTEFTNGDTEMQEGSVEPESRRRKTQYVQTMLSDYETGVLSFLWQEVVSAPAKHPDLAPPSPTPPRPSTYGLGVRVPNLQRADIYGEDRVICIVESPGHSSSAKEQPQSLIQCLDLSALAVHAQPCRSSWPSDVPVLDSDAFTTVRQPVGIGQKERSAAELCVSAGRTMAGVLLQAKGAGEGEMKGDGQNGSSGDQKAGSLGEIIEFWDLHEVEAEG